MIRFRYVLRYKRNIQELRYELRDVNNMINKVHQALDMDQPSTTNSYFFSTSQWLLDVNEAKNEAERVNETAKVEKGWLNGWCPNVISHYRLSKEAEELAEEISALIEIADNYLTEVAISVPTTEMGATKEILYALNIAGNNIIGLYGEAGIGKTTEAINAGERAIQIRSFNEVVGISAPQDPDNLPDAQRNLLKKLGLEYCNEISTQGNAKIISDRLSQGGRTLLILDDVCKVFDMTALGIPSDDNCKVIVISREEGICDQMRCQVTIPIFGIHRGLWGGFKAGAKEWAKNAGPNSIVRELVDDLSLRKRLNFITEEVEKHIADVKRTIAATANHNQRMEKNEFRIDF